MGLSKIIMNKILTFPFLDDVINNITLVDDTYQIKGFSDLLKIHNNELTVLRSKELTELVRKEFYGKDITAETAKKIAEFLRQKEKQGR